MHWKIACTQRPSILWMVVIDRFNYRMVWYSTRSQWMTIYPYLFIINNRNIIRTLCWFFVFIVSVYRTDEEFKRPKPTHHRDISSSESSSEESEKESKKKHKKKSHSKSSKKHKHSKGKKSVKLMCLYELCHTDVLVWTLPYDTDVLVWILSYRYTHTLLQLSSVIHSSEMLYELWIRFLGLMHSNPIFYP